MATETTETESATTENTEVTPQEAATNTSLMDELEAESGAKDKTQTTEAKGDDPKDKAEGEKSEEEGKKEETEGAPEEYADFTVEEGIALNQELMTEFKAKAKELNLPQDKAQTFVDMAVKLSKDWSDKAVEAFAETRTGWREATKSDPDIGGAKLPEVLSGAKAVRDSFGSPELTEVLNTFGLGDHPAVIKFFHSVRQAVSEDKLVKSGKPVSDRSTPQVLYGETMKAA